MSATCRVFVDFLVAACRLFFTKLHNGGSVTWPPPTTVLPPGVFADVDLSVEIVDPSSGEPIRVVGRANYTLGHECRKPLEEGAFSGILEVEERDLFSMAEGYLLAHLAILRELNIQQRGLSPTVQGFFTDGGRFTFLAIRSDGIIQQSKVYEVGFDQGDEQPRLKTVFNFIVAILDTMRKEMPYTDPAAAGSYFETVSYIETVVWPYLG